MPLALIIALSLHALAAVFWAGTSFALARIGGPGAERLLRPQLGAALVAVLTGAYIWSQLHRDIFDRPEQVLAIGAVCALVAAGVQATMVARAVRLSSTASADTGPTWSRIIIAQRAAAGLLAVTLVCMTIARYV
ncbi:MAG: hypothetical protein JWO51_2163 [Rhodospirillales bacterium]|nr:hypothetical protein [Rhodospirillales bacterium]